MAETEGLMSKDELKKLLKKSKKEPLNCAVAEPSGGDRTVALLLVNRVKAPKAVAKMLEKEQPEHNNLRWGSVTVDAEDDPKQVIFTLHKKVSGFGKKLKKTLKGTGFNKVRIVFEDGSPAEDIGEDEDDDAAPAKAGANAGPDAAVESDAAEEPEPAAAAPDAARAVAQQKSQQIWLATRTRVGSEIAKLRAALDAAYAGSPIGAEVGQRFEARVAVVLETLDDALAAKLAAAAAAPSAAEQAKLAAEAKQIIARYAAFVAADPLIKDLDENPFAPTAIRQTVGATLAAVAKTVG